MGDDELILGHRNSEWCGRAPIIEEDIAFANIALDEIGHASLWFGLLSDLEDKDSQIYPDHLVFMRPPHEFRNIQLVELPVGDWAFSILRQYLFDACETFRLQALEGSSYRPLAEAAAKVRKEEIYHSRHTSAWVRRLGLGTEESHRRLQAALDIQWPYTLQIFTLPPNHDKLSDEVLPGMSILQSTWEDRVRSNLTECGLRIPDRLQHEIGRSEHTPHLPVLVEEMQSVAQSDPAASW
jgi:ring-1,2-phenylacetyl-CoA epoxidase subunit PaaC